MMRLVRKALGGYKTYNYRDSVVARSDETVNSVRPTQQKIDTNKKTNATLKKAERPKQAKQKVVKKHSYPKMTYSGGNKFESRNTYLAQEPRLVEGVDSIATRYGISPKMLMNRFKVEGQLDALITRRNLGLLKNPNFLDRRGNELLHEPNSPTQGIEKYGFDWVGKMVQNGDVVPINELYTIDANGKIAGKTTVDNIGLMAATLKYYRQLAEETYPNASPEDLDRYAVIYYNAGPPLARKLIKLGTTRPEYNLDL